MDRFYDLLVLTEQIAADLLGSDSARAVKVSLATRDKGVEVLFESEATPAGVTRLTLERLADRHWVETDDSMTITGFSVSS